MTSELLRRRAQRVVAYTLKHYPAGVRAMLPMDPADPEDVGHWLDQTIQNQANRFTGPPGAVIRRLRWNALDAARKARRRLPRGRDDRLLIGPDSDPLQLVASKPPDQTGWDLAIEDLATDAAAAASLLVDEASSESRSRRAIAVLACIARGVAAVHAGIGPDVARLYLKHLVSEPTFRRMPLATARRHRFIRTMVELNCAPTGVLIASRANHRRDLKAAGQPWPQVSLWKAFKLAFYRCRSERLASITSRN